MKIFNFLFCVALLLAWSVSHYLQRDYYEKKLKSEAILIKSSADWTLKGCEVTAGSIEKSLEQTEWELTICKNQVRDLIELFVE